MFETEKYELWHGDCLELMKNIPDKSVDCIITDLPYGVTAKNKWDTIIPFEPLGNNISDFKRQYSYYFIWTR